MVMEDNKSHCFPSTSYRSRMMWLKVNSEILRIMQLYVVRPNLNLKDQELRAPT